MNEEYLKSINNFIITSRDTSSSPQVFYKDYVTYIDYISIYKQPVETKQLDDSTFSIYNPDIRITFNKFDSVRICKGEETPYMDSKNNKGTFVSEVINSRWLKERNEYNLNNSAHSLFLEHKHYLICFHDEFIEVIAKGIWFDKIENKNNIYSLKHPINNLSLEYKLKEIKSNNFEYIIVRNPLPIEKLIESSNLWPQKLFQFYYKQMDKIFPGGYALVETINNSIITKCGEKIYNSVISLSEFEEWLNEPDED